MKKILFILMIVLLSFAVMAVEDVNEVQFTNDDDLKDALDEFEDDFDDSKDSFDDFDKNPNDDFDNKFDDSFDDEMKDNSFDSHSGKYDDSNDKGEGYDDSIKDKYYDDKDDKDNKYDDGYDNSNGEEPDSFEKSLDEDIYEDIGEVELKGNAGLTPDSNFYFLESLVESVLVGDNPETALNYKEEKVQEFKEMVEQGNNEGAQKALEGIEKYNAILKKEVTPELDRRVRESSKATKKLLESYDTELDGAEWDDIKDGISDNIKSEDRIALAAKISNKIRDLCETLAKLDPLEYSNVCRSGDDSPKWKRDLDQKLTAEQEVEAREFL